MPDYPGALEHYVPRDFVFDTNTHQALVLHKTGGDATPDDVYNTFMQSRNSVHYGVGTDGSIQQYVPEALGAGGNCCVEDGFDPFWEQFDPVHVNGGGSTNLNTVTLSIEHCDPAQDNSTELAPAQQAASFKLVAYLVQKYNIPLTHIKGHNTIDPIDRARCPGNYPWTELFTYLRNGGVMVPTGWTDDGTTLTAPNGKKVVHGFRDWVLSHNWDSANWPLTSEFGVASLEASNTSLGSGTQQIFRFAMLGWTQQRGVFLEWLGVELAFCRQQVQRYAADNAQLKADLAKATAPVPTIQGVDPLKVKAFQAAAEAKVSDLQTFLTTATF
jgi:N-acetylmuramoyl-L-alanine amidase-like protein